MSETLFTATDRELVELHVRSSRGKVIMGKQRPRCSYDDFSKPSGEHLHHYCRGCGYDWFEDVRDV